MLQTQTVTAETLALTKKLMADTRWEDFNLVGGTALALRIGHCQTDLNEFYRTVDLNGPDLNNKLAEWQFYYN